MTPRIEDYDCIDLRFAPVWEGFESIRHPEDGDQLFGTAVWIQATAPDGCRFRRLVGAADWVVKIDEEYGDPFVTYAEHTPAELSEFAKILADHLEEIRRPRLNPDAWEFAGAVYGSEAYERLGLEYNQF